MSWWGGGHWDSLDMVGVGTVVPRWFILPASLLHALLPACPRHTGCPLLTCQLGHARTGASGQQRPSHAGGDSFHLPSLAHLQPYHPTPCAGTSEAPLNLHDEGSQPLPAVTMVCVCVWGGGYVAILVLLCSVLRGYIASWPSWYSCACRSGMMAFISCTCPATCL